MASTVGSIQAVLAQTIGMNNSNMGGNSNVGNMGNMGNVGSNIQQQLMGNVSGNNMRSGGSYGMDNNSSSGVGYSTGNNMSNNFANNSFNNDNSLNSSFGGNNSNISAAAATGNRNGGSTSNIRDGIVVRNLPTNMTWQTLREGFSQYGDVKFADMKERGVGFVRFSNEQEAQRAVCEFFLSLIKIVFTSVFLYTLRCIYIRL